MPKTKLGAKFSPKPPEIDWLWAAVLERKMVMRYDLREMAAIAGVSYDLMRKYIGMSPWDWPNDVRKKVVTKLGIPVVQSVKGAPELEEML